MVSITLSVDKQTRDTMKQFPEVNWSGFVRSSILAKTKQLSWKTEMLKKLAGEKTQQLDDISVGRKVNAAIGARLKNAGL